MAEIEYKGIKVGGSKLLLVLPLVGTIIGGLWGGFEFYKDYNKQWPYLASINSNQEIGRYNIGKYAADQHFQKVMQLATQIFLLLRN